MANQKKKAKAGWYERRDMFATMAYWDGNAWTGDTAPITRFASAPVQTIAAGVALGTIAAGLIVGFILNLAIGFS